MVAGYRFGGEVIDFSVGVFNGKIDEVGDDDTIDSFVASIVAEPLRRSLSALPTHRIWRRQTLFPNFLSSRSTSVSAVGAPLSLFSFLSDSNSSVNTWLQSTILMPARSTTLADTQERQPSAWNVELGAAIIDSLELAVRYGGSDDGGADFLPESQYGAILNWGFFKNTNLALEYLHDEYEDDVQEDGCPDGPAGSAILICFLPICLSQKPIL